MMDIFYAVALGKIAFHVEKPYDYVIINTID